MTLDTILGILCGVAEIAVICLLIFRRFWRVFPFFASYSAWTLIAGVSSFAILHWYPPSSTAYISTYLIAMLVDSFLLFGVLVELAWSVLRPIHPSLPRGALIAVIVITLAVGAAIWPFATIPSAHMSRELAVLLRLKETFSVLSVLAFLTLAASSQLLAIGWRNREMQIATGLGIYSLVAVTVTVLHTYPSMLPQYNRLDEFVIASYLFSLLYWVASFARQEEERREFTPQMQHLLLSVAGAARSTRVALNQSREKSGRS